MIGRQRNQHVATIRPRPAGELSIHVARWTEFPNDPMPLQVMWVDGGQYRYLPPDLARRFAAALLEAADQIDQDPASTEDGR